MSSEQAPINSGFGHGSTAMEVVSGIDLAGKTAFVTGGYSGLGTETVKALHAAGAQVIVAGRRPEEADKSLGEFRSAVKVVALDLSDPASINACAEVTANLTSKIDLLINNAGIMACPFARDARGYESQFATNHLGHFQLAARLWSLVRAAGDGARVIALSSAAHKRSGFNAEDPNYERRDYEKWEAYGQAKTANALFARQLDKLAAPLGIRAFSVHPGGIQTNLGRYLEPEDIKLMMARAKGDQSAGPTLKWKTADAGAATTIWAATSQALAGMGGVYCEDCDIAQLIDPAGPALATGVFPHACDDEAAEKLWGISETLTGTPFSV